MRAGVRESSETEKLFPVCLEGGLAATAAAVAMMKMIVVVVVVEN